MQVIFVQQIRSSNSMIIYTRFVTLNIRVRALFDVAILCRPRCHVLPPSLLT